MTLKELAEIVHKTLDANKSKWGMIAVETQYLITYELAEKLFAWIGELDEHEIENLNETFWSAGIEKRDFDEVARAIAIILEVRCVTPEDVEQRTAWFKQLQEKANAVVRRINLRQPPNEKKHEKEWRYGEFTKFDFIQAYGYMYDSEDEANADANDTSSACPVLMGLLNSGWANIKAVEDKDTGKITVSKREENVVFSPALFLAKIAISFETLQKRRERKFIHNEYVFEKLMWRQYHSDKPSYGNGFRLNEFAETIEGMIHVMMNESIYSQEVFDFRTYNHNFIMFIKRVYDIINNLDETQDTLVKSVVREIIDKMKDASEIEVRIVHEQKMRDEQTGRFIKPKFNIDYLVYTYTLASVLNVFKTKYDLVNRIDNNKIYQRQFSGYPHYRYHLEDGTLDELIQKWKEDCRYSPFSDKNKYLKDIPKYEKWYKEESASPFYKIYQQYEPLMQAQYLDD